MRFRRSLAFGTAALALCGAWPALAAFTVGSANEAVVEPPVLHPNEAPCVVPLYKRAKFGANNVNFTYTPPAGCPGPYAVIVLDVSVGLDKGIQYDRSGLISIAGVPVWFGTTAEPTPFLGPQWHFQRDVTDFTALLTSSQSGFVNITNYTNPTDNSIITSTAQLLFYKATTAFPAPRTPDLVLPLSSSGGLAGLNSGSDSLSTTVTLPTNIVDAKLDVYLQGQSGDEFWYTCVPDALAGPLESCGGGSVREGEISIDGTPAGVSPVYPWIFTGGIDPYLWSPIPGVQTLNFKPFQVELAPFAGVLSNGQPHNIALSAFGANGYFSAIGALKLFLDPTTTQVTGTMMKNTLTASPAVTVTNHTTSGNAVTGNLNTVGTHDFAISGTVVTSAGTTVQTVRQTTKFTNDMRFLINDKFYIQNIDQLTTTQVFTSTTGAGGTANAVASYSYPLKLDIEEKAVAKGNIDQVTSVDQKYLRSSSTVSNGQVVAQTSEYNATSTTDLLELTSNYSLVGNKNQKSQAVDQTNGLNAACFQRVLTAADNVLTSAATGC